MRILPTDFFIMSFTVQEGEGNLLRVGRAEDELQHAGRDIHTLFRQGIQIGK